MIRQRASKRSILVADPHGDVDVLLSPVQDARALLDQLVV